MARTRAAFQLLSGHSSPDSGQNSSIPAAHGVPAVSIAIANLPPENPGMEPGDFLWKYFLPYFQLVVGLLMAPPMDGARAIGRNAPIPYLPSWHKCHDRDFFLNRRPKRFLRTVAQGICRASRGLPGAVAASSTIGLSPSPGNGGRAPRSRRR